jgi:hypothetical protein
MRCISIGYAKARYFTRHFDIAAVVAIVAAAAAANRRTLRNNCANLKAYLYRVNISYANACYFARHFDFDAAATD